MINQLVYRESGGESKDSLYSKAGFFPMSWRGQNAYKWAEYDTEGKNLVLHYYIFVQEEIAPEDLYTSLDSIHRIDTHHTVLEIYKAVQADVKDLKGDRYLKLVHTTNKRIANMLPSKYK